MIVDDVNKDVFKKKLGGEGEIKIQINIMNAGVETLSWCAPTLITKEAEVPPLSALGDWLTSRAEAETHNLDGAAGQQAASR